MDGFLKKHIWTYFSRVHTFIALVCQPCFFLTEIVHATSSLSILTVLRVNCCLFTNSCR